MHRFKFPILKSISLLPKRTIMHQVFVYGTLKRGEPNNYWLMDTNNGMANFIAEGHTKKKYPLIIATKYNIPFLLDSPGNGHNVVGEIFEVDDTMLSRLDVLEDHPNYYIREKADILCRNQMLQWTNHECWVYFLKNFKPELLKRPHLECYTSSGEHGLIYKDSNNESVMDDLDDDDVMAEVK